MTAHANSFTSSARSCGPQVRDGPSGRSLSILQGSRQIDLLVPKTDNAQASVTFSKQGPLVSDDFPLLGRLMLLSNDLNLHKRGITSGPTSVAFPFSTTLQNSCH